MPSKFFTQALLSSLVVLCISTLPSAYAQEAQNTAQPARFGNGHPHPGQWQKGQHHGEGFMSQLGLSDEQKQKMKALHQNAKQENGPAMEALKAKHQQLREFRKNGQGDSAEAKALREQLKQEHQAFRTQREAQMKGVLTPEQFQKWQAMKQERMAKMREHRQHQVK